MNTIQITKMCNNIYADYKGMGRSPKAEDNTILNTIMHLYNVTELDWEEVKWLWITYLDTGILGIAEAIEMARIRIANEIRVQRMKWLDK